mgnify:CR=1 FL=1
MSLKASIVEHIEANSEQLCKMAQAIWQRPEVALEESFASNLQAGELENSGFSVERNVADMPTAFVASWGEGSPVIGILGEYDALPGLSQTVSTERDPIESGGPGHGCGHNLFGTAGVGAAIAVKEALETEGIRGTIRYYGCPAEETLVGKTFMARAGVFNDLDAAITWHPGSANMVVASSSTAMNSFRVNFYGAAAHSAGSPHLGRSALDGVQLMDIGVNYLREHVIQEARLHSVVTSGGQAPNVVPAFAQAWWYVRAPNRKQVDEIYARVLDIAKGAALMTGTTHDIEFITGCYDFLPNKPLADLMLENMQSLEGSMTFDDEEMSFAKNLQASFPEGSVDNGIARLKGTALNSDIPQTPLLSGVIAHRDNPPAMAGSTEVGDVSHITPTVQLTTTCWPVGTPGHSWQTVASSGSSIGLKGMMFAAKSVALTAFDLLTGSDVLEQAKADFKRLKKDNAYVSPLPEGVTPH